MPGYTLPVRDVVGGTPSQLKSDCSLIPSVLSPYRERSANRLKIPGVSQIKKGGHRRSYNMRYDTYTRHIVKTLEHERKKPPRM